MRTQVLAAVAIAVVHLGVPPAQPARPPVFGISHVAIHVSDLGKARAFYGDLLGFAEQAPRRDRSAIFVVNDRQRLIVRDGLPASRDERFLGLAFETQLPALRARLSERRMTVSDAREDPEVGGTRIDVSDPDGHPIVFVEHNGANAIPASADRRISRRILHAGLTVKDAAAADAFYKDALGFSETWRGGRPEGTINWINMRVPDGTDYLEYMLFPAAPPDRRQLGSAHHVALLVQDIQQALETVRARTRPDDPNHRATPQIGVNRRWQLNVFDPDGTRVEFMEPWTVR
jgi:lactoylglutathione lyase